MFNFSANHLFLLSRTEYPSCAVFLLQDGDTQRVYRLYDFTKAQLIRPNVAYCVAGKVNSADKLYLVIVSVRPDTKHAGIPAFPFLLKAREGRLWANFTVVRTSSPLAPAYCSRRRRGRVSNWAK
jgi:hypothetical protein